MGVPLLSWFPRLLLATDMSVASSSSVMPLGSLPPKRRSWRMTSPKALGNLGLLSARLRLFHEVQLGRREAVSPPLAAVVPLLPSSPGPQ